MLAERPVVDCDKCELESPLMEVNDRFGPVSLSASPDPLTAAAQSSAKFYRWMKDGEIV